MSGSDFLILGLVSNLLLVDFGKLYCAFIPQIIFQSC